MAVLEEDGVGWFLEEDVGARIALGEFLVHLGAEIVFFVLGFPVAAREVEGVEDGGVDLEGVASGARDGIFGDDCPLVGAGAFFKQALEGAADVAFVVEVAAAEFIKRGVVFPDRRVCWLQLEVCLLYTSPLKASSQFSVVSGQRPWLPGDEGDQGLRAFCLSQVECEPGQGNNMQKLDGR